ncbi:unnamed protein product [Pedinophyceae sp. YPF-701]|nr:unnamed protein product [Pedinophyceae sp. YPF-701]
MDNLVLSAKGAQCPLELEQGTLKGSRFISVCCESKRGMVEVHQVIDSVSKVPGTLKVVPKKALTDMEARQLEVSVRIHARLAHPNVLPLYLAFSGRHNHYVLTDRAMQRNLYQIMKSTPLTHSQVVGAVLKPVLAALSYAHGCGVAHRDVKPENVVFGPGGRAMLAGFDLGVDLLSAPPVTRVGTLDFTAPEVLLCGTKSGSSDAKIAPRDKRTAYTEKVDVWSLGMMLYELVVGTPAFARDTEEETRHAIVAAELPELPPDVPEIMASFIRACLEPDPAQRPTTHSLLTHPLITGPGPVLPSPASGSESHAVVREPGMTLMRTMGPENSRRSAWDLRPLGSHNTSLVSMPVDDLEQDHNLTVRDDRKIQSNIADDRTTSDLREKELRRACTHTGLRSSQAERPQLNDVARRAVIAHAARTTPGTGLVQRRPPCMPGNADGPGAGGLSQLLVSDSGFELAGGHASRGTSSEAAQSAQASARHRSDTGSRECAPCSPSTCYTSDTGVQPCSNASAQARGVHSCRTSCLTEQAGPSRGYFIKLPEARRAGLEAQSVLGCSPQQASQLLGMVRKSAKASASHSATQPVSPTSPLRSAMGWLSRKSRR